MKESGGKGISLLLVAARWSLLVGGCPLRLTCRTKEPVPLPLASGGHEMFIVVDWAISDDG